LMITGRRSVLQDRHFVQHLPGVEDVAVIDACCLSVDSTHDASGAVCAHNTSWTSVTLKFRLGITQGHCKWHHLIDRTRVPVSDP